MRTFPSGGTGYERPEWSDDALLALADRFFDSSFGAYLDDGGGRVLGGRRGSRTASTPRRSGSM